MAEKSQEKKEKLSVDDFILAASKYISEEEIRTSVKRYMIDGEMMPENMISE